uniref:E3 ubiquitin-protein ligase E3D n=1 Tax=Magallana gigas TaxID=29159 RepID=K1Q5T8_MAGGI
MCVRVKGRERGIMFDLRLSENISLDSNVCVENDTITVEDVESSVAFKFKDIVFEPTTCRNLQYDKKGEVTLTVQVKRPSSETLTVVPRSHNQQEDHFLRVMPLPSENWSDFSDMWFCHNHSHSNDSGQATNNPVSSDLKLRPKLKDCLVAETYFLVVSDQIKEGNIQSKEDVSVYCRRCRNLLGEVMPREKNGVSSSDRKVTKILRSSVLFHLDLKPNGPEWEPVQHRGFEVEDMFASLLMNHSRMYTSFKLYVTSSTEGKPFHCLVVMRDTEAHKYPEKSYKTNKTDIEALPLERLLAPNGS